MDLYEISCLWSDVKQSHRSAYLRLDPEAPDFTDRSVFKAHICIGDSDLLLEVTPDDAREFGAWLDTTVFDKDCLDRLYTWNLKSLISYIRFFTGKSPTPSTAIYDLKVIENFLGIRQNRPENFADAVDRMTKIMARKIWPSIYKTIHLPLLLRTLPIIETNPLLNVNIKRPEFPFYEIEGQPFGRMNCLKKFSKSYVPHNMGPDIRAVLRPRGDGYCFLNADFRHCEVSVLQWLSSDPKLKEFLDSNQDLHCSTYEALTNTPCDNEEKREMGKMLFFPVMYGCGAATLAKTINVSEDVARELIRRLKVTYPVAWKWMEDQQEKARAGVIQDYCGRPRKFEEAYRARDFMVQGTAATACQEKLIDLVDALDGEQAYMACSVHDGVYVCTKLKAAKETYHTVKTIMESPSKVCPGLSMKVQIKLGPRLDAMKVFEW